MKATYKCIKCNYLYKDKPGPTTCPQCGHNYIKWLNYNAWYEQSDTRKYNCERIK